jgi:hypothetical protein
MAIPDKSTWKLEVGCEKPEVRMQNIVYVSSAIPLLTSDLRKPFGCQLWEDIQRALRIRLAPSHGLAETNRCAYSFPSSPLSAIMPQEIGVVNFFRNPSLQNR